MVLLFITADGKRMLPVGLAYWVLRFWRLNLVSHSIFAATKLLVLRSLVQPARGDTTDATLDKLAAVL